MDSSKICCLTLTHLHKFDMFLASYSDGVKECTLITVLVIKLGLSTAVCRNSAHNM